MGKEPTPSASSPDSDQWVSNAGGLAASLTPEQSEANQQARRAHTAGAREALVEHLADRGLCERHGVTQGTLIYMRSKMAWAGKPAAPRPNGNGKASKPRERRARRTTSGSSTAGSGPGDLDPPPGAARLFHALAVDGLDPSAYGPAVALCLELDRLGSRAGWRHISRALDEFLDDFEDDREVAA
jgi:hypothetical protein